MDPLGRTSLERIPGAFSRAMTTLFLKNNPSFSRESFARGIHRRLEGVGLHYHLRTVKRQLSGGIETVPLQVEQSIRSLLIESNGLRTDSDIQRALAETGLEVREEDRVGRTLSVARLTPLYQLWLTWNPDRSKRYLAILLHQELAKRGTSLSFNTLQSILTGGHRHVRREIVATLLNLLSEHGIESEEEARIRWQASQSEIQRALKYRKFESAERFQGLANRWKFFQHEPSSRRLALLLTEKLKQHGIPMSLHHVQESVDGKTRLVRRILLETLEGLVDGQGDDAKKTPAPWRFDDLSWVEAPPIAELARRWREKHPSITMRKLAIRVSATVHRLGYSMSLNAVQSVLGGHKKRTRGFIYRAMLKQFEDQEEARIPEEHRLKSLRQAFPSSHDCPVNPNLSPESGSAGSGRIRKSGLKDYLSRAKEYLPQARSGEFLRFVAFRAERLFGIPRDKAQARILGRRRPVSTTPPDEESEPQLPQWEEQGDDLLEGKEFPHGPSDDDATFQEIQATLKNVGT